MTEQDEILHSIAIEKAVQELGLERVIGIIEGLEQKDLEEYFRKKDALEKADTTEQ